MRAQEYNIIAGGVQAEPKQRPRLFRVSQAEKGPMWLFPVEGRMKSVIEKFIVFTSCYTVIRIRIYVFMRNR